MFWARYTSRPSGALGLRAFFPGVYTPGYYLFSPPGLWSFSVFCIPSPPRGTPPWQGESFIDWERDRPGRMFLLLRARRPRSHYSFCDFRESRLRSPSFSSRFRILNAFGVISTSSSS